MTLGGANVWSNFSYGICIDSPNGWLINAEGAGKSSSKDGEITIEQS